MAPTGGQTTCCRMNIDRRLLLRPSQRTQAREGPMVFGGLIAFGLVCLVMGVVLLFREGLKAIGVLLIVAIALPLRALYLASGGKVPVKSEQPVRPGIDNSLHEPFDGPHPERAPATEAAFTAALQEMLDRAATSGSTAIDIEAGDLHRSVGGYPGPSHRMPMCCSAMTAAMKTGDEVLRSPKSGKGASLTVRYQLPQ